MGIHQWWPSAHSLSGPLFFSGFISQLGFCGVAFSQTMLSSTERSGYVQPTYQAKKPKLLGSLSLIPTLMVLQCVQCSFSPQARQLMTSLFLNHRSLYQKHIEHVLQTHSLKSILDFLHSLLSYCVVDPNSIIVNGNIFCPYLNFLYVSTIDTGYQTLSQIYYHFPILEIA